MFRPQADPAQRIVAVLIPSSSGNMFRPMFASAGNLAARLNPFFIREYVQAARRAATGRMDSLNPFFIREYVQAIHELQDAEPVMVLIPSSSGNMFRQPGSSIVSRAPVLIPSSSGNMFRLLANWNNIPKGLNPFFIREYVQAPSSRPRMP